MKTTSLDISKRLYDLSGWTTGCVHHNIREVDDDGNTVADHWGIFTERLIPPSDEGPPAYTLEYLLDKLPRETNIRKRKHDDLFEVWYGRYDKTPDIDGDPIEFKADNPTDAAALLAIALIEGGVIDGAS